MGQAYGQNINWEDICKLFSGGQEGLFEIDDGFTMYQHNEEFYRRFSLFESGKNVCSLQEWVGFIHEKDKKRIEKSIESIFTERRKNYRESYRIRLKNQSIIWLESRGFVSYDNEGHPQHMLGVHKDITNKKYVENSMRDLAYKDELTGLFNQNKLYKELATVIAEKRSGALIYLNISQFKLINEVYGESEGNRILIRVAEILKRHRKANYSCFRLHGDEFMIFLEEAVSIEDVQQFSAHLRKEIQKRFPLKKKFIRIRAALSICELPMNVDSPHDLIQRAKLTMRYGREKRQNALPVFDENIEQAVLKHLHIQAELKDALESGEFYLKYHPIVNGHTGEVLCFETLLRWRSPLWGEIYPDEFIPVAEKNREIIDLGWFVLRKACQFARRMQECHGSKVCVSVNVSVVQLMQRSFVSDIKQLLEEEQVCPDHIVLEITESLVLETSRSVLKKLVLLKKLGLRIALDDFGTGYSSLNNLMVLPLGVVKIDRLVMKQAMQRKEVERFIGSVIKLCQDMELKVVAEGIEEKDMVEKAKILGADLLQGYFYTEPLLEEETVQWILQKTKFDG